MTKEASASSESLLKLDNQLCFPLYALSRLVTKAYQPYLQALDLTYPQYLVLLALWEHRELTVKALGEKLLLDSGTLTPLLKRMEQRHLLSRTRDAHDERSVRVALLPAGQELRAKACEVPQQMLHKLHLSPSAAESLRTQLQQLISDLT
ncbi:MarR family transcriptional regulator [Hymenobacter qilianensis]|uniref:MarR family transcriptional regulator n=2 Tax=Hymenobacter qilianensis TaxID=1385715 RepID=A0ACB5PSF7_9BACT|nr:MarR family transcriptional regulator [Hymenobacter qilianensis]QNP52384.1 MarR family transcriptional regulator [Hymenobacter qilianensis]GGF67193.1 MarR family transcriptional regulator [Hymenobacter qilianensis]